MLHIVRTVRKEPHTRQPMRVGNDVYLRVQGADGLRYQDGSGRIWSRVATGELFALVSPGSEPTAGDVIDLQPWPDGDGGRGRHPGPCPLC